MKRERITLDNCFTKNIENQYNSTATENILFNQNK